jgi:NTE family protein
MRDPSLQAKRGGRETAQRKLGLALGAGGARGVAHVGVLFALAEAGIAVDAIAGTSIGALVGALHATGQLEVFERDLRDLELSALLRYLDPVWPRSGLLSGERVNAYLYSRFGDWRIEDLPIPFAAVAVDLVTGDEIWLREGRLVDAVRASISLPGIFVPQRQGARLLVDGALRNPVPVTPLEALGADVRVAVNLQTQAVREIEPRVKSPRSPLVARVSDALENGWARLRGSARVSASSEAEAAPSESEAAPSGPNLLEILAASMSVLEHELARHRLAREPVDLILTPDVRGIRSYEFQKGARAIAGGRAAVEEKLAELQALLRPKTGLARYFSLGSSS